VRRIVGVLIVLASAGACSQPEVPKRDAMGIAEPRHPVPSSGQQLAAGTSESSGWSLVLKDHPRGHCLEIAGSGGSSGGCGFDLPRQRIALAETAGPAARRFIFGPVVKEAAEVRLILDGVLARSAQPLDTRGAAPFAAFVFSDVGAGEPVVVAVGTEGQELGRSPAPR
jgi:hypothetical protein